MHWATAPGEGCWTCSRTRRAPRATFPRLSRFAVMKHLRVLELAGLLVVTRDGRKRWNALNPVPLREVFRRWVGRTTW